MKFKLLFSLLLGGSLVMAAEGYQDGVEYFRADQPEEAYIILNKTLSQPGTDQATAYYYLGQIALKQGDKTKAEELFNKGMAADATNGYNYVGLGAIALKNGDKKTAEDYFKKAKSFAKKDADVLTEVPRAYFDVDPVAYAVEIDKWLADIKKTSKNTAPAPFILEGDRLANTNVGEAAGMYEMAATFDHESKTAQDAHPEAYVKYARVIFKVNERFAIDKLRELLGYQPNSALVQRELAEKLYDANQLTNAAKQYEAYIQNPNSFQKDKQRLVGLLYFAKRYPESYDLATQILNDDPGNYYMERMQFYNKKAMGDTIAAVNAAEKLLANPDAATKVNSQDYVQYAELLSDMGNDEKAITMYENAVAVDPEKASLLKDLSQAYNHGLRFQEAADAMQKYVDMQGDDVDANDLLALALRYNALATAEQKEGNSAWKTASDKAVSTINRVVALTPEHPLVLNYRSRILLVANNNEVNEAVVKSDLETLKVLDSDPANLESRQSIYVQVLGRLGNYYVTNHDMDSARKMFTRFYEIQPSEDLQKYIETLK
jgi:tetratricopeptide (TPR) repeat protein